MWKIIKAVKKGDYLYGVCYEHPNRTKHNYVLLHRLVVENYLGRLLKDDEIVHHKNGDKHDNRIENLEVMSCTAHAKHHARKGRKMVLCVCPNCDKVFHKEDRQVKVMSPKCSRKCNGEYSRKIQLGVLPYY